VTFSTTTRKWTITSNGAGGVTAIALSFNAAAARYFGFPASVSAALAHTGAHCAYFVIDCTLGGVTELTKQRELALEGLAVSTVSAGGVGGGLAQERAARGFELTIPDEPAARVWHENRSTTDPWTWELAFLHCRNIEPFYLLDSGPLGIAYVGRFRDDCVTLDAQLAAADYFAYASIPIRAFYYGTP
jgi:hypothetical protein